MVQTAANIYELHVDKIRFFFNINISATALFLAGVTLKTH